MMDTQALTWPLAALAGVATIASPCVLPVLPLLLGSTTANGDRRRPLFIVAGFVLSFAALVLLFSASVQVLGVSADAVRLGAVGVMLLAGVLMVWPALGERAMAPFNRIADMGQRWGGHAASGPAGGLLLGATLGALWTPCAGPVLASILALVASQGGAGQSAPLLLSYAAGAGLPMLAVAYGGQAITRRVRALSRHAGRFRQVCGVLITVSAIAMLGRVDVQAQAWLTQASKAWLSPAMAATTLSSPDQEATAPEFTGIDTWLNSPPLTLSGLRGKVVLVEFWTQGCINCVRTLPHIQRWHERFAPQGLVVVGVHTPEFASERSTHQVRAAIQRHGLSYPVAQDNRYQTWNAYRNQYWPALYLIDRAGRIVYRHFGEGQEAETEAQIARWLATPSKP